MKIGDASKNADSARLMMTYGTRPGKQTATAEVGLFDAGQLLKGRVVSVGAGGLLTIETEGGSLTATATGTVPVGQELLFEVVKGGASPLLAEAGKANAVLNLLRVMLPGMFGVSGADTELGQDKTVRAFLEGHALNGQPDPVKLAKTMSQFSQSQSGDGKQLLPSIAVRGEVESLATQKMSHLVEAHAMVNQTGGGRVESDFAIFPVFFAEQAGKGEWLFSFDRSEEGADGSGAEIATLSFYLAMSRLGDIHITLTTGPQSVLGVISLSSDDAAEHVRLHLPPLAQAIEALTGAATVITCRSGPVDCLKALKDDLTSRLGLVDRYALVDLRA